MKVGKGGCMNQRRIEIDRVKDQLFSIISKDQYKSEVSRAENLYRAGIEEQVIDSSFNDWLIFDYRLSSDKKLLEVLLEEVTDDEEISLIRQMNQSFVSFFEVNSDENETYLKDVVTKRDYVLDVSKKMENSIVLARIMPYNHKYYVITFIESWDKSQITSIRKSVFAMYNDYCKEHKNVTIDQFIKNNSLLFYKYLAIYKDVKYNSLTEEENLYVHQSVFAIKKMEAFKEKLEESNILRLKTKEYNYPIYELIVDGFIISEVVLLGQTIEVECKSKEDLEDANQIIKECFTSSIEKVKEETLNIEDLL